MVPQRRYHKLTISLLAILATPNFALAQYFTNWNTGYGSQSAPVAANATQGVSPFVARHVTPSFTGSASTRPITGNDFYPLHYSHSSETSYCDAGPTGCTSQACGCETVSCYQPRPRGLWYASAAGLYLARDQSRRVWTTYENNNNANQLMNTHDAETDWEAGADLRLGRFFACNCWALELGYWSVNNFSANASQTHVNNVSSPLQFNDLEFAIGDPVLNYFDDASEHRISRNNELHNVELNLIEGNLPTTGCCPWSHQMLFGVRYFKFDEDLSFESLDAGGVWGGNGGLDEVRLSDSINNDLIGVQLGCLFQRQLGCRTRLLLTPKFGVYNNHIEHSFDLRRGDGTAAVPSAASGVVGSYPVESSTDQVAFLSEASLGLQYQATHRCTLVGGYRVVVLNNVGLADNQIPQFIIDIPEIADIDTNGSLVLQGAYFGATCSF